MLGLSLPSLSSLLFSSGQALSLLVSGDDKEAEGDADGDGSGDGDGDHDGDRDGNGGSGDGDAALPGSGVRLAVVFNPSAEEGELESGEGDGAEVAEVELAGRWLPAVFEAVGSRAPDKVCGEGCRGVLHEKGAGGLQST